jgi:hypothetical protein
VGPTCQPPLSALSPPVSGSVAPCHAPIGCRGRRCPNAPSGLKIVPTASSRAAARTRRPASPIPTGCLSQQRHYPSRCRFALPSRPPPSPGPSHRRRVRSRRRRCLHRPCAGECGRAVTSLAPPSALIFSLVPVGRRRRPRSTCHPMPPSTPSCRAAVHAPVSPATLSPAVSRAPVRSPS